MWPRFKVAFCDLEDALEEVVANCDHLAKLKFSKVLPHAFTEHGAIQAANLLAEDRAKVEVAYTGPEAPGTIVVDTHARKLYHVLEGGE